VVIEVGVRAARSKHSEGAALADLLSALDGKLRCGVSAPDLALKVLRRTQPNRSVMRRATPSGLAASRWVERSHEPGSRSNCATFSSFPTLASRALNSSEARARGMRGGTEQIGKPTGTQLAMAALLEDALSPATLLVQSLRSGEAPTGRLSSAT
jgi:hypothetical protein